MLIKINHPIATGFNLNIFHFNMGASITKYAGN